MQLRASKLSIDHLFSFSPPAVLVIVLCLVCFLSALGLSPAFAEGSAGANPTSSEQAREQLQAGAAADRPIRDKWAVLIGVSKFANGKIPVLKYPSKDAKDLYDYLVSKGNFARDHVLLLRDEKASKVNILDAFGDGWLPRRVLQDDLVLVFISSHGSPADVAGENFIIAYDSDPERPYATGIRLQDLSNELTKRTGCDRIVLLLDACHSGAAVSGQKGLTRSASNFNLDSITGVGQLIISSSAPDESSWESKRYENGVFTRQLINALSAGGPQMRLSEAYKKLRESVEQEVKFDRVASQIPMMLSRWQGSDLSLAAPASEPRTPLPEIVEQEPAPASPAGRFPSASPSAPPAHLSSPPALAKPKPSLAQGQSPQGQASSAPKMMCTDWLHNGGDSTLESGTTLINPAQIEHLSEKQLLYLYNEAYARHGRGFLLKELQQYFEGQSWYKIDPDYHYLPGDPRVLARRGQSDDALVINEKRTPKQWANMMTIKNLMDARKRR